MNIASESDTERVPANKFAAMKCTKSTSVDFKNTHTNTHGKSILFILYIHAMYLEDIRLAVLPSSKSILLWFHLQVFHPFRLLVL